MQYSDIDKEINKLAQQFGLGGTIRESINIGGHWMELTNSDFRSIMNDLREVDKKIRNLVTGENTSHRSLKNLLKIVEKNLNKREYAIALSEIVKFYDIVCEAAEELKQLDPDFLKSHYQLLSSKLSPDQMDSLFSLKKKPAFAGQNKEKIVKQAGVLDFLYGIFSSRGRALKAWEKRFPRSAAKLKKAVSTLLKISVSINNFIVNSLNKMKEFRINRKVEDYLEEKKILLSKIDSYKSQFKSSYDSEVKEIIRNIEEALTGKVSDSSSALPQIAPPAQPEVKKEILPAIEAVIVQPVSADVKGVAQVAQQAAANAANGVQAALQGQNKSKEAAQVAKAETSNGVTQASALMAATISNLIHQVCEDTSKVIDRDSPAQEVCGALSRNKQSIANSVVSECLSEIANCVSTNVASAVVQSCVAGQNLSGAGSASSKHTVNTVTEQLTTAADSLSKGIADQLKDALTGQQGVSLDRARAMLLQLIKDKVSPVVHQIAKENTTTVPSTGEPVQDQLADIKIEEASSLSTANCILKLKENFNKLPSKLNNNQVEYLISLARKIIDQLNSSEQNTNLVSSFRNAFIEIIENCNETSVLSNVQNINDILDQILNVISSDYTKEDALNAELESEHAAEEEVLQDEVPQDSREDLLDRQRDEEISNERASRLDKEREEAQSAERLARLDEERDREIIQTNLQDINQLAQNNSVIRDISQQQLQELSYLRDYLPSLAELAIEAAKNKQTITPEEIVEVTSGQNPQDQITTLQNLTDEKQSKNYQQNLEDSYDHIFTQKDVDYLSKTKPWYLRRYSFDFNLILGKSLKQIINECLDDIFKAFKDKIRTIGGNKITTYGKKIQSAIELIINSNKKIYCSSEEIKVLIIKLFQIKLNSYLQENRITSLSEEDAERLNYLFHQSFIVGDTIFSNISGVTRRQGEIQVGKVIDFQPGSDVIDIEDKYLETDDTQPNLSSSSPTSSAPAQVASPVAPTSASPSVPPASAQSIDPFDLDLEQFTDIDSDDEIDRGLSTILSSATKKTTDQPPVEKTDSDDEGERSLTTRRPPKINNPMQFSISPPSRNNDDLASFLGAIKLSRKKIRAGALGMLDLLVNEDYDPANPGTLEKLIKKCASTSINDLNQDVNSLTSDIQTAIVTVRSKMSEYEGDGKNINDINEAITGIGDALARIIKNKDEKDFNLDKLIDGLNEIKTIILTLKSELR